MRDRDPASSPTHTQLYTTIYPAPGRDRRDANTGQIVNKLLIYLLVPRPLRSVMLRPAHGSVIPRCWRVDGVMSRQRNERKCSALSSSPRSVTAHNRGEGIAMTETKSVVAAEAERCARIAELQMLGDQRDDRIERMVRAMRGAW